MFNVFTQKQFPFFLFVLLLMCGFTTSAQTTGTDCDTSSRYLYWTGEQNNDFFNEKNWRITNEMPTKPESGRPVCFPGDSIHLYSICPNTPDLAKDKYPKDNTLEPGQPIKLNLYVENGDIDANGSIVFACSQKGITLIGSKLNVHGGSFTSGVVSLQNESTVHLREGSFSTQLTLNFLDNASWVYTHQENPDGLQTKLDNIHVNDVAGTLDVNFRINQYYQTGAVIRPMSATYPALKIFSDVNQQGNSANVFEDVIYKGSSIPGNMDNATHSFILKRGYMATFAVNTNGTGKSKVYIASEQDLTINALDVALQGNVRFMRVVPWNWVTKKGTGFYYDLNSSWFYNWNYNGASKPNTEYVPMAWGATGALPPALKQILQNKKATHELGFNESDDCNGQSGQYNNLCDPAVAVAYYENLMGLGLRLGSPSTREQGPTTWLTEFNRIAKERNVRFDFVGVHWYDWGSNPASSPNADPQQIFNRFKAYLEKVHNLYNLPIWITEFNANINRGRAIQEAFLQLAIPYLESLDYVERYAYFQPGSDNANYFDQGGNLTDLGTLYKNFTSTPSMPQPTYICPNNLEGLDQPYTPQPVNTIAFEAECGSYPGNQWQVLEDQNASNGLYIRGNTNLTGTTILAKEIHYEFDVAEANTYRVYIRAANTGGNGSLRISMDGNDFEQITPLNSASFDWLQIPRFYELGIGKHRLSIQLINSNLLIDQVALTTGSADLDSYKKDPGYCTPAALKWGLESSDVINFYEAEAASSGSNWSTKTTVNAIGGAFEASAENVTSADAPEGTDNVLTFNINVAQSDEYEVWAKIQAISNSESSLWISVDNEPYKKWGNLTDPNYEWYWKKFHYTYGSEDRSFTYFLEAGQHTVKIALASGNVAVDRLAVATKGKLPESVDPNVLLVKEKLEFEAELATFLGTVTVQNCTTSSNGQQVVMGNVNTNGVRFAEIVADAAGPYKLKVSYMSKVSRTFRLIVNGTVMGKQTVSPSGNWCYEGGSPAVYEVTVILKRGLNTIDITPFSGDGPFIDKIKLEPAQLNGLSLEAELAELLGTYNISTCAIASNGAAVNMGTSVNNGVRFNNLVSSENKTYQVDIYYISKVQRSLRLSMNGQAFNTLTFAPSGNWCYETNPSIGLKSIQADFTQGTNTLEFRPTGTDAPFIDRIVIHEPDPTVTTKAPSLQNIQTQGMDESSTTLKIYPNPVRTGSPLMITLPSSDNNTAVIQITDLTGRLVYAQTMWQQNNKQIQLTNNLSKGMYMVTVLQGQRRISKKIIIQ